MTTPTQGEHAQTEALNAAQILEYWAKALKGLLGSELLFAAAILRRLHAQVAALTAAPEVPKVALELPAGDTRTANVYWSEMRGGTLHLCISVDTSAQPAAPQGVAYATTPDGEPSNVELRGMWYGAGGTFHGPNVETGTMPEAKLLPFLRSLASHGQAPAGATLANLRKALQFYADGHHFVMHDETAWDTVSGEPVNFYEDEAGTATVENGSIAKLALAGHPIKFEDEDAKATATAQATPAAPFNTETQDQIAAVMLQYGTEDQQRAALAYASAAPAAPHPIAPDVAADLERSDWTPEEALRWYAAGKHYDTVPNGDGTSSARILDNGAVASNALKSLSRDYAEHKGDVALMEGAAPAAGYDHGPQSVTVAEAARHVGKWLNERPNSPLDLRDVAMLCAHAQKAPAAGAVAWPTRAEVANVFLANGFTVKEGQSDLKPYVYDAAYALLALAAAPTPAAQADSQPAPVAAHVVADALADSQYLAGVSAGWNAANADDPNAALQKLHESRAGYLKPLSAARDPADSVLEDAERYRHLRDCNSGSLAVMQITGTGEDDWCILTEDDADAAIDAARKQGGA